MVISAVTEVSVPGVCVAALGQPFHLPLGMCPLGPGLWVSCNFAQNGQVLETSLCPSVRNRGIYYDREEQHTKEGGCMVTTKIHSVQPGRRELPGVSILQGTFPGQAGPSS